MTAAIDPATRAVNVTGFDFNQNYVSTNAKADGTFGKKLIIEFDVSVEAGFLGGNQVPTNDGQSGIYAEGTMIKAFDVPTQDVEVKASRRRRMTRRSTLAILPICRSLCIRMPHLTAQITLLWM